MSAEADYPVCSPATSAFVLPSARWTASPSPASFAPNPFRNAALSFAHPHLPFFLDLTAGRLALERLPGASERHNKKSRAHERRNTRDGTNREQRWRVQDEQGGRRRHWVVDSFACRGVRNLTCIVWRTKEGRHGLDPTASDTRAIHLRNVVVRLSGYGATASCACERGYSVLVVSDRMSAPRTLHAFRVAILPPLISSTPSTDPRTFRSDLLLSEPGPLVQPHAPEGHAVHG